MLSSTDKYKLSLYNIKQSVHSSTSCDIYLTQSSLDNKLYIKRVYKDANMFELFSAIRDKKVRNTPKLFELFYDGSNTIVIEEYIPAYTADSITLTKSALYTIIISLLISVEDLHSINIIHRDIKPANILVTNDYKVYLIDFGIARFYSDALDCDTTLSGTKGFAAPEQYGFQQTDFRSDIYSIGKTISSLEQANNINSGLKSVIDKAISFDPKDRYNSIPKLRLAIKISRLKPVLIMSAVFCFLFTFYLAVIIHSNKSVNIDNNYTPETTINNEQSVSTEQTTLSETSAQFATVSAVDDAETQPEPDVGVQSEPDAAAQHKTDVSTADYTKTDIQDSINILHYKDGAFYYNGLTVPDGTAFMEMLGNEVSKSCGIMINGTYVTVECIRDNSSLTVNLTDTQGHKDSFITEISDAQLRSYSASATPCFNAYVFFLDYNNDGNTEIFVNFTDAAQLLNEDGKPITVDYGSGSQPYVVHNINMLKLVEHSTASGFYVYAEDISTYSDSKFTVGGSYTDGIFCDEYSTLFIPHDGIITEKNL